MHSILYQNFATLYQQGLWVRMLEWDNSSLQEEKKILENRQPFGKNLLYDTIRYIPPIPYSSATFLIPDMQINLYLSDERKVGFIICRQNVSIPFWQDGYLCRRATDRFEDFTKTYLSQNPLFENDRSKQRHQGYDYITEEQIKNLLLYARKQKFKNKQNKNYNDINSVIMKWNEGLIHYQLNDIIGILILNKQAENVDRAFYLMHLLERSFPIFIQENFQQDGFNRFTQCNIEELLQIMHESRIYRSAIHWVPKKSQRWQDKWDTAQILASGFHTQPY